MGSTHFIICSSISLVISGILMGTGFILWSIEESEPRCHEKSVISLKWMYVDCKLNNTCKLSCLCYDMYTEKDVCLSAVYYRETTVEYKEEAYVLFIIGGVLGFLSLLVLLFAGLEKCGCFERQRRRDTAMRLLEDKIIRKYG